MDKICIDCAIPLTEEEAHYYEYRCEDCERAYMKRLDYWMCGGEDDEFDFLFGAQETA